MTTIRRTGTSTVAVLSGLALTLGIVQACAPDWVRRAGFDVWNLHDYRDALRASAEESTRLQIETEMLRQSQEVLESITARLSAGMISLDDATGESEPLLRERPGFATTAEVYYPAPTLRLSIARYLISRVARQLLDDPSSSAKVAPKLEAEYAQLCRK